MNKKALYKETPQRIVDKEHVKSVISLDMEYGEDTDGNIIFISPTCERITGYSVDEFKNDRELIKNIILPEDLHLWDEQLRSKSKDTVYSTKFRIKHKQGNIVWIDHACQTYYDDEGFFAGFRGVNRDITNSKLIFDIYNTSPSVLFLWENKEGWPVTFVSENILNLSGYSVEDFLSNKFSYIDIIHSDDIPRVSEEVKSFSELSVKDFVHKPYRIITQNGEIKWVDDKTQVIRNKDGVITHYQGSIIDITTKIIAELKLKDSEQRYRITTEATGDVYYKLNFENMEYEYIHPNLEKLTGYKPNEIDLRSIIIKMEKMGKVLDKKILEINRKEPNVSLFNADYLIRMKNGEEKWISDTSFPYFDDAGWERGSYGVLSDISERKYFEETIRKSKNKYLDLFEKSTDAILIIQNGKFVDCNEATVKMLGYKNKSELLLTHPSELSPEKQSDGKDSAVKAEEMMNIAIEKGSHSFEWDHVRADDEVFPVEVSLTAITNEDGTQIIHTTWRDITGRKKKENLQNALFNISEEASKAVSIDEFYKSLHNIIKELMSAKNFYIAIHSGEKNVISFPYHVDEYDPPPEPQPLGNGLTEYVLRTKRSQIITEEKDLELQKKGEVDLSGELTKIWIGIYLKFEGDYKGVLVLQDYNNENAYDDESLKVLQFVSEHIVKVLDKEYAEAKLRNSFKELSIAKEKAENADRLKSIFLAQMSHEIRTPINAMLSLSSLLKDDLENQVDEDSKMSFDLINKAGMRLIRTIDLLLNLSEIQAGTYEIIPKRFNFYTDVLGKIVVDFKKQAKDKGISIEIDMKTNETEIVADSYTIEQIFVQLLDNSIKYTDQGEIKITVLRNENKNMVVEVSDTGIGISKEYLPDLFQPFSQEESGYTRKYDGNGIGLALVNNFCKLNDAKIEVESEQNKGSTFRITFPT